MWLLQGAVTGSLFQAPCLSRRPSLDMLCDAGVLENSSVSRRQPAGARELRVCTTN